MSPIKKNYSVLIDTTDGCNLHCVFCTRTNSKIHFMSANDFDHILNKINLHTSSLQISCAWEYSIAKNSPDIIQVLNKYSIPLTSILTHGNNLSENLLKSIVTSNLSYYTVSLGETNNEIYKKIRVGGDFDKVIENIRRIKNLKKEKGINHPILGVNLVVMKSTINEMLDFVELAHKTGIQKIIGRHLILNEGLDNKDDIIVNKKEANSILDEAENLAHSYGIEFEVPRYIDTPSNKNCQMPWSTLYISSNGDVSVCPRIHTYLKIGNLLQSTLEDIDNSVILHDFREQHRTKKFNNPVCGICENNLENEIPINQGF